MISSDRATQCATKVVLFLIVLGTAKRVYQNAGGVKHGVFVVFEKCPMKIIGSRFIAEIGDPAAGFTVLCGIIGRLHLEFSNRVCPWAEFIQAAPTEVVTANGDTINEDFM